jgi:hypothetical protein
MAFVILLNYLVVTPSWHTLTPLTLTIKSLKTLQITTTGQKVNLHLIKAMLGMSILVLDQ